GFEPVAHLIEHDHRSIGLAGRTRYIAGKTYHIVKRPGFAPYLESRLVHPSLQGSLLTVGRQGGYKFFSYFIIIPGGGKKPAERFGAYPAKTTKSRPAVESSDLLRNTGFPEDGHANSNSLL